MLSQKQIKNLLFDTIEQAENNGRRGEFCIIKETSKAYMFIENDISETDGLLILRTGQRGNTRWKALGELINVIEDFPLTATHIANKCVFLSYTPSNLSLEVFVRGGPPQTKGKDYTINLAEPKKVTWLGYDLENELEEGDVLVITYSRTL